MKNEWLICLFLLLLFIATLLVAGQRGFGLQTINDRLTSVEDQAYTKPPAIIIQGRAAVYAGSGQILIDDLRDSDK